MSDIERIWITDAVKAIDGALKLRVLGGPYGIDKQGHEFHAGTDFADVPIVPVISYHGWDALDGARIGWATKAERDESGQWYEVSLDPTDIGKKLYADAQAGKVRASSDSIQHLVRPENALKGYRGKIDRWPIGAISLMGADKYDRAMNPRAIAVPALKAFYDELITSIEADSGEPAAKAGAVFAGRNAARIKQLKQLVDELTAEMPEAFQDAAGEAASEDKQSAPTVNHAEGAGVKAEMTKEEMEVLATMLADKMKPATPPPAAKAEDTDAAAKAVADKAMEIVDKRLVEAGRPKFATKAEADAEDTKRGIYDYLNRADTPAAKAFIETKDERTKAFGQFLAGKATPAAKALLGDDDVRGGFILAPQQFVAALLRKIDDSVVIRQVGTRFTIDQAESLGVPTLDTDISDADWTSELNTGSEDDAIRFGKRELYPRALAKRVKVSNRLRRQAAIPVDALVQERLSYKFGVTMEKAYMTGDGNGKPLGLFTASANGISTARDVTTAGAGVVAGDDLIDALYSLKEGYMKSPTTAWVFHRDIVKRIRKLKASNGEYLFDDSNTVQYGLNGGAEFPTLLGKPVIMSEFAPNTYTSGNYIGLIGDMRFYYYADALALAIQVLNELYAETNQTGFIGRAETDGMPALEEAFARIKLQ
jgi:HK97 family phage major capsid protein